MKNPLANWNDRKARRTIADFVRRTTTEGSADFIPEGDRIAVFDNDGTLWTEQPVYSQLLFAIDRVRAMAPDHPEWNDQQPFKAVIEGDMDALMASGKEGLAQILAVTHAGMTADEFAEIVRDWIATAQHPVRKSSYPSTAYVPMLELLDYLRANGYLTFIVSGGGVEFMRAFAQDAYGIPPEQIVGSTIDTEFQIIDGKSQLVRKAAIDFVDDGPGKPVGINRFIGRRPVIAVGNSDGDLEMLQYATGGEGPRLAILLHHDDDVREVAYDRGSEIGGLDVALDEAVKQGWTLVSMKNDFVTVFAGN